VPTIPHLEAVRGLSKHGIVLLLGDPASYKADGVEDLIARLSPK